MPNMSTVCSVLVGSGMYPIRFENRMKKNSVPMNGNHFLAIESSMLPRVIWLRVRS